MQTFAMLLLFCALLSGCGQTGSLYLPQTEQSTSTAPTTEASNDQQ